MKHTMPEEMILILGLKP